MLSVYGILFSALLGSFLTLLAQVLLFYRRSPEPPQGSISSPGPSAFTPRVVPDHSLREYLAGFIGFSLEPKPPSQQASVQDSLSVECTEETLYWLNAICLFLFRELKDTSFLRHWVTRKIKVEFEELLQTKVTGKVLEGLSLRDVGLGNVVPLFKNIKILRPVTCSEDGCPEELDFELDLEYQGGFHLAIDADLVFGKSAYLFAKISRVVGRVRLVFTRLPFTHWSFCFVDEPLIDLEVKSQFEGRPLPQLTSIIVSQFKKVIKRKHTLPHYKIRFKPFFPFQVEPPEEYQDRLLSIKDFSLTEGRLKLSLIECARLLIFGSYEREVTIHCTFELSENVWEEKQRTFIKTVELIKGNSPSVGLSLRQVQAKEGESGHVVVETVIPNSAAAAADLQRGDRLIAIGGVRIISTVQVLKLIRQAGEKVIVYYERPVRVQDTLGQMDDAVLPDGVTITEAEIKEVDLEFEDLAGELKSSEYKDDLLTTSPKHTSLGAKQPGSVSPVLNRKTYLGGHQLSPRALFKEAAKQVVLRNAENADGTLQINRPNKPPVPPRPLLKMTPLPNDTQNKSETGELTSEKLDKLASSNNEEGNSEKSTKNSDVGEEPVGSKPVINKPEMTKETPEPSQILKTSTNKPISNKTEVLKDSSEATQTPKVNTNKPATNKLETAKETSEFSQSFKPTMLNRAWESPEIPYRNRLGKWARTKVSSYIFEVQKEHKYLNVAIWCRDPFKLGGLICLGYESINLEEIALDCIATSSMEFIRQVRLNPPAPKATVSRTALRTLTSHKGFNENFCYGDITLHFKYLKEGESEDSSFLMEKEKETTSETVAVPSFPKEDPYFGQIIYTENKHNFQDTQFQNPTWCDYCKKKVWTKAASQCVVCAYVCHKKCQERCLTDAPYCIGASRRLERALHTLKFENQDTQFTGVSRVDPELKNATRTTGLTRHIMNTGTRLLNLRQVPKVRVSEPGTDTAEPSPRPTPHHSDNEGSDTDTGGPSSPSKASSGTTIKLARKEGGLDDSVFIAVKEIGRDLYRSLPTEERIQKLEVMLEKLQNEIDQELENNNSLIKEKKETTDTRKKMALSAALAKSGERLQALTLLMIHYKAGIEDIEALDLESRKEEDDNLMEDDDDNALAMAPVLESLLKEGERLHAANESVD
ncbi:PDZ domain-containing protein 8 isoform X1 [Anolis carolinensis]|nr:PREDICTED: PDZ domain-containing protein 8 [Anolis carolinensis]|eukprot:XP_008113020.2 PREDICTED: PDZ domain-containing protein 8 [Anolis carolinensis]